MVDVFLSAAQLGFVTAYIYFIVTSIHAVFSDAFGLKVNRIWFGKGRIKLFCRLDVLRDLCPTVSGKKD
jgi:hypothetical protein